MYQTYDATGDYLLDEYDLNQMVVSYCHLQSFITSCKCGACSHSHQ